MPIPKAAVDKLIADAKKSGRELPSAIRFYAQSVGAGVTGNKEEFNKTEFTEKDFSEEELVAIRTAVQNAKAAGRTYISYEDYPTAAPQFEDSESILGEVKMLMDDPARSAMFTLGLANFDKDGVVTDTYDFAASPERKIKPMELFDAVAGSIFGNNRRAGFNLIGNLSGLRAGTGRPIRIKTQPVNETIIDAVDKSLQGQP